MSCRKIATGLRGSMPTQEMMTRMKMAMDRIQARIWTNRTAASIGLSPQPLCLLVGRLDGLDESESHAGLLKRPQPLGGGAPGRGDLVAQVGEVLSGGLGVPGRAQG